MKVDIERTVSIMKLKNNMASTLELNRDVEGEIINGEGTYNAIAFYLMMEGRYIIGWTDEQGTHYDILFVYPGTKGAGRFQGGINPGGDLIVSIMRVGAFAFDPRHTDTHWDYYSEKLNVGGSTAKKLGELINAVKIKISHHEL